MDPEDTSIGQALAEIFAQKELPENLVTVNHQIVSDEQAFVYVMIRTTSWELPGERTDANDIFSTLLGVFLRFSLPACAPKLADVPHPAIFMPEEVYARYLTLEQPHRSIFNTSELSLRCYENLLDRICEFYFAIRMFVAVDDDKEAGYEYKSRSTKEWFDKLSRVLKAAPDDSATYCRRISPSWLYYRCVRQHISVVRSRRLASRLRKFVEVSDKRTSTVSGIGRDLILVDEVKLAPLKSLHQKARRILKGMGDRCPGGVPVSVCLDNRVIYIGTCHVVIFERNVGYREYENERQRLWIRHRTEGSILFPATNYIWNENLDDERFENFVKELIEREPGVTRVRKAGHSRDSDQGKDLVAEWLIPKQGALSEECSPAESQRVVIQVKAATKSVGKAKVLDVRDTIDHHDAKGFFLVVSTWITSDLMNHLEKMRLNGEYFVDWWSRSEIEQRLNANSDIVGRYQDVVKRFENARSNETLK